MELLIDMNIQINLIYVLKIVQMFTILILNKIIPDTFVITIQIIVQLHYLVIHHHHINLQCFKQINV